jgi:preprotein translocase subunit Sec63
VKSDSNFDSLTRNKKEMNIVFVASLLVLCLAGNDYYAILGVPRNANDAQIKKAFKKASVKYHPDKNPGDEEAADMYSKVTNAYNVLSNSE